MCGDFFSRSFGNPEHALVNVWTGPWLFSHSLSYSPHVVVVILPIVSCQLSCPPPILRREKFQIQVQPCFYFTCGPGTHSTIFTAPALHSFDPAHRFLPRSPLLLNYFLTLYILFSLVVQSTLGPRQHRNSNHRPHPKSVTLGGER
jgi:hypothetical protein